ncbi:hypothetical protein JCM10207_002215 [Rhodosporidiobolus poonsookiae]
MLVTLRRRARCPRLPPSSATFSPSLPFQTRPFSAASTSRAAKASPNSRQGRQAPSLTQRIRKKRDDAPGSAPSPAAPSPDSSSSAQPASTNPFTPLPDAPTPPRARLPSDSHIERETAWQQGLDGRKDKWDQQPSSGKVRWENHQWQQRRQRWKELDDPASEAVWVQVQEAYEAARGAGTLDSKEVSLLDRRLGQFRSIRELKKPWEHLGHEKRFQEVGLHKARLINDELNRRRSAGQSVKYTNDNHPLLALFGPSAPSTPDGASPATTAPSDTSTAPSPSFDATLSSAAAASSDPPAAAAASSSKSPAASIKKGDERELWRSIDKKVFAHAKANWPKRQEEIVRILNDNRCFFEEAARKAKRRLERIPPGAAPHAPVDGDETAAGRMAEALGLKDGKGAKATQKEKGKEKEKEEQTAKAAGAATEAAPGGRGRLSRRERRRQAEAAAAEEAAAKKAAAATLPQAISGSSFYANHPALRNSSPPSPEPRELSSYAHVLSPSLVPFAPHPPPAGPVPIATLAHSLDRVLFNPGVHFLRDPRTGVYNFDPEALENVPRVDEFAFDKLPQYVTSSRDEMLKSIAESEGRTFVGSTSSTVGMLCQIYFWLSKGKEVNLDMLSADWQDMKRDFSMGQQLPVSVVLHHNDGRYAIDADKSFDAAIDSNILADYGHLMEKLLTTEAKEFQRFLTTSSDPALSEADQRQAYHYALTDHLVLRSQLDAHNPHLPNKTFDLKTRGTVAIRQDRLNYEESAGYTIDKLRGHWESFEREYYDLIRSAFLKYQFQARIGHMDGVLVAYHSTTRFYGFQYVPIAEMDEALFGTSAMGDQAFKLALGMLEKVLQEAAACYPGESVNVTWAADTEEDVLRVFVTPQKEVEALKQAKKDAVAAKEEAEGSEKSVEAPTVEEVERLPMTLLEVRGTNYLDGEAQEGPMRVPDARSRPRRPFPGEEDDSTALAAAPPVDVDYDSPPVWQLGYEITKSTGAESPSSPSSASSDTPPPVPAHRIAALFAETRAFQMMFSTLTLPTGVTPAAVAAAAERAQEAGVELDPSDLSVRFPAIDGIEYRGPGKAVKALRRRAREGAERLRERELEEEREREKGTHRRVQVVSSIEVVEQ